MNSIMNYELHIKRTLRTMIAIVLCALCVTPQLATAQEIIIDTTANEQTIEQQTNQAAEALRAQEQAAPIQPIQDLADVSVEELTANNPTKTFARARVVKVVDEGTRTVLGREQAYQVVRLAITNGPEKGKEISISQVAILEIDKLRQVAAGDQVIISKTEVPGVEQPIYHITDRYRATSMIVIFLIFIAFVVILSRWKGLTSMLGLGVSVIVLAYFIVPQIVAGSNPFLVSLIGALIIATLSLFLAHGWNTRTKLAYGSTVITLAIAAGLSVFFVAFAKLFGLGSEEATYLQLSSTHAFNLKGLLLGGILIGTLGVLDDITTAQVAVVDELSKANKSLDVKELYARAISVGREHIASLVNTLVLAYAGASLPLFLIFTMNTAVQPLWVTLNSEFFAEEVIRTLVGSTTLVLAVPITTYLAAFWYGKKMRGHDDTRGHSHHHSHSH